MDILGIGPMELIVILIVALVVFGPDRLPEMGARLGKGMRSMRRATREFSQEIESTRKAVQGPIDEVKAPLQELAQPIADLKALGQAVAPVAAAAKNPGEALRKAAVAELTSATTPALSKTEKGRDAGAPAPADSAGGDQPTAAEAAGVESAVAAESETLSDQSPEQAVLADAGEGQPTDVTGEPSDAELPPAGTEE